MPPPAPSPEQPPATATPAEPATSTSRPPSAGRWITRFLRPGDQFGRDTLTADQGGIELFDGSVFVDTTGGLAELGHTLIAQYDPPGRQDLEAAGLDIAAGGHTWRDVARAALNKPVIIFVAEMSTRHFDWVGTGRTDAEARGSLMRAWRRHAEQTGADPRAIEGADLNVRHGIVGTGWRDYEAFAPP